MNAPSLIDAIHIGDTGGRSTHAGFCAASDELRRLLNFGLPDSEPYLLAERRKLSPGRHEVLKLHVVITTGDKVVIICEQTFYVDCGGESTNLGQLAFDRHSRASAHQSEASGSYVVEWVLVRGEFTIEG